MQVSQSTVFTTLSPQFFEEKLEQVIQREVVPLFKKIIKDRKEFTLDYLRTGQQVQDCVNISRKTLLKWERAGVLPNPIWLGGRKYYDIREIEKLISK